MEIAATVSTPVAQTPRLRQHNKEALANYLCRDRRLYLQRFINLEWSMMISTQIFVVGRIVTFLRTHGSSSMHDIACRAVMCHVDGLTLMQHCPTEIMRIAINAS
ncbi:hypothetical protein EVAR_76248_1 [Eumeta japonica]|uniref:Uncharacterized protein n=1 Tax=Eumeta variegata TaxID=151549 RepID=A0A4C1UNV3_EUMVA|nr:hypothetical protein EVAR_76248_1 [Eumeta japonica]